MSDQSWLTEAQLQPIKPFFPRSHGVPRIDDRPVVSGIIHVIRNGLRWRDSLADYGPHRTLYNRFIRWSKLGIPDQIFSGLSTSEPSQTLMIDSTHLKAYHTASSLLKGGVLPRPVGRTKGGLNARLHAICDEQGRPLIMLLTEGQVSDHKGAAIMLPVLP